MDQYRQFMVNTLSNRILEYLCVNTALWERTITPAFVNHNTTTSWVVTGHYRNGSFRFDIFPKDVFERSRGTKNDFSIAYVHLDEDWRNNNKAKVAESLAEQLLDYMAIYNAEKKKNEK